MMSLLLFRPSFTWEVEGADRIELGSRVCSLQGANAKKYQQDKKAKNNGVEPFILLPQAFICVLSECFKNNKKVSVLSFHSHKILKIGKVLQ